MVPSSRHSTTVTTSFNARTVIRSEETESSSCLIVVTLHVGGFKLFAVNQVASAKEEGLQHYNDVRSLDGTVFGLIRIC